MENFKSKTEPEKPVILAPASQRLYTNYPKSPTKCIPSMDNINIGSINVKLGDYMNTSDKYEQKVEAKVIDYPIDNEEMSEKKGLSHNLDSKYAKCTVLDMPDNLILKKSIPKICRYFDSQFAIFHTRTSLYTIVNRDTMAITSSINMPASHQSHHQWKRIDVIDVGCNWSTTDDRIRHLCYAYYDSIKKKTIIINKDGKIVTDKAKSRFMIWNDDTKKFDMMANVKRRVMHVYHDDGSVVGYSYGGGSVVILTDKGLEFYVTYRIRNASSGDMIKTAIDIIAVDDASHCIQSFAIYDNFFVILTDKGMIQYLNFGGAVFSTFKISHTTILIEASMSNTVFSCITCVKSNIVIVAGFDIDECANMMIVLDVNGNRLSKIDDISHDDGMPIVDVISYHDHKLDIIFVISSTIRSVYVHCMNANTYKMKQIFDRSFDGIVINGVINTYTDGKGTVLMIYGQRDTRGEIIHMQLNFNVEEIRNLK